MKSLKYILLILCGTAAISSYAQTTTTDTGNTTPSYTGNDQAPLGVATDRVHSKGQWMAAYTYSDVSMSGNRLGTTKIGNDYINQFYRTAPDKMSSQTHMATVMYAVSDRLAFMATGGYMQNSMTMTVASIYPLVEGNTLTSKVAAFADTRIGALYNIINKGNNSLSASLGVNLPTGTITAMGPDASGRSRRLPYLMQTGAGTFGVLPSVTYLMTTGPFSYGAAASSNINIGKNPQGYRWGNTYNATVWGSYRILSFLSASLRAEYVVMGKLSGSDNYIDYYLTNDPSSDNNDYGGKRINLYAGLNCAVPKLKGLHVLIEYGIPVYQNLDGPQMSEQAIMRGGVQYVF